MFLIRDKALRTSKMYSENYLLVFRTGLALSFIAGCAASEIWCLT